MKVPLLDLKAQYKSLEGQIVDAVCEVLQTQQCIGGLKVENLEKSIAKISDCKYAVGVSSGTDAILNVLMSLDIGAGDEVITTPFTFFATAGCIARTGAKPVFVDIDPKTFNIDVHKIEVAITKDTKAIMPVHLYGQMAEMDLIMDIAERHNLQVIEDAAQAITSTYKGRKAGSIGMAGCFSFFPSKNLGAAGDGGMIVTNDEELYERLVIMRNHGSKPKYYHKYVGGNFRLDPIQAVVIDVKLPYLDKWSQQRREHCEYYDKRFANSAITTPFISDDCVSVRNQYVIRVSDRDGLKKYLQEKDIGTEIYYPLSLHLQECFNYLGYKEGDFFESEKASKEVLALPIYPEMTEDMLDYVATSVLDYYL